MAEQKNADDLARWILRHERRIRLIEGGPAAGISAAVLAGRKDAWEFLTGLDATEENLLAAEERAEHPLRMVSGDGE